MKFATLNDGTRDGKLLLVSRDTRHWASASDIAPTLQAALDRWDEVKSALEARYAELNAGDLRTEAVDVSRLLSPLPRAYEWVDGSAYIHHVRLVRKARGAEPPETLLTDPLVYQGGSSTFLRPTEDIRFPTEEWGTDFESEVAVVLGDVPMGTTTAGAEACIRLVMLVNDVTLRNLIPDELAKGFGFFRSKPSSAFSPFALTPDELGASWKDGRVHRRLVTRLNGEVFGEPHAGPEMHFSFHDLIAFAAMTRSYGAGTILGSGTVSNEERATGSSCLAERRMIEKIDTGTMSTPFLRFGDEVEIEMLDDAGVPMFGTIRQRFVRSER